MTLAIHVSLCLAKRLKNGPSLSSNFFVLKSPGKKTFGTVTLTWLVLLHTRRNEMVV